MQLEYKNSKKARGLFTWRISSKFLSGSSLKSKLGTNLEDPKLLQKLAKNFSRHFKIILLLTHNIFC